MRKCYTSALPQYKTYGDARIADGFVILSQMVYKVYKVLKAESNYKKNPLTRTEVQRSKGSRARA